MTIFSIEHSPAAYRVKFTLLGLLVAVLATFLLIGALSQQCLLSAVYKGVCD